MYFSHQELQAIHQDIVNDGLRRSKLRRMRKGIEKQADTRARAGNTDIRLTALLRLLAGVVAR